MWDIRCIDYFRKTKAGNEMRLKNFLIVVNEIESAKAFYQELFGFRVVTDFGKNVILTEGLVLQEKESWEQLIETKVAFSGKDAELYFEENDMDGFLEKLENTKWHIKYVNPVMEYEWGQRVVRIYDLDNHVIEVRETMEFVVKRFLKSGMTIEETAKKTKLPIDMIEKMTG